MRVRLLVALFFLMTAPLKGSFNIVITFDNLPIQNNYILDPKTKTEKYIQALSQAGIQTVFFAVGKEIEQATPEKMECIERLVQEGHRIANHSYTHPHLSEIAVADYIANVLKCEELITQFATYRRWFRYPFLDIGLDPVEGASVEKALHCASDLKALGFRHGYVTIDSFDWFISSLLSKAVSEGRTIYLPDLEAFYIDHLRKTIQRYLSAKSEEEKSLFSTHVFLFHANDLNALCLPRVIEMLKAEGWTFAPPEEAFDDPKNQMSDFDMISIKIQQYTGKPVYLHSSETTTREFSEQVLHEFVLN